MFAARKIFKVQREMLPPVGFYFAVLLHLKIVPTNFLSLGGCWFLIFNSSLMSRCVCCHAEKTRYLASIHKSRASFPFLQKDCQAD